MSRARSKCATFDVPPVGALEKRFPAPAPAGYEGDLSAHGTVLFDHGEPIAWGFRLIHHLDQDRFEALRVHGELCCIAMGQWCLVTRWLTKTEAIRKYGQPTVERGPRGGFRAITFGTTRFASEHAKRLAE